MSRIDASSPRSERARVREPFKTGGQISVISALRLYGVRAMMMIQGAVDGQGWDLYIEQLLVPEPEPGDIVLLYQIPCHGSLPGLGPIEAAGGEVEPLPAYSPDIDPMEECISKIKEALRSRQARTHRGIQQALARAIEQVTPGDIRGWFRHCGYTHLLD